jgi:hypothetical protein
LAHTTGAHLSYAPVSFGPDQEPFFSDDAYSQKFLRGLTMFFRGQPGLRYQGHPWSMNAQRLGSLPLKLQKPSGRRSFLVWPFFLALLAAKNAAEGGFTRPVGDDAAAHGRPVSDDANRGAASESTPAVGQHTEDASASGDMPSPLVTAMGAGVPIVNTASEATEAAAFAPQTGARAAEGGGGSGGGGGGEGAEGDSDGAALAAPGSLPYDADLSEAAGGVTTVEIVPGQMGGALEITTNLVTVTAKLFDLTATADLTAAAPVVISAGLDVSSLLVQLDSELSPTLSSGLPALPGDLQSNLSEILNQIDKFAGDEPGSSATLASPILAVENAVSLSALVGPGLPDGLDEQSALNELKGIGLQGMAEPQLVLDPQRPTESVSPLSELHLVTDAGESALLQSQGTLSSSGHLTYRDVSDTPTQANELFSGGRYTDYNVVLQNGGHMQSVEIDGTSQHNSEPLLTADASDLTSLPTPPQDINHSTLLPSAAETLSGSRLTDHVI